MSLRSLLIVAPGALLLIAALAFVFVNKDGDHGHDHHGHSHGAHSHHHAGHAHSGPAPQPSHNHSEEWREHYGNASQPLLWKSLLAAHNALADGLGRSETKRETLTRYAETVHLTAHALWEQVSLPSPEAQQRLGASLSQTAALADTVLEALQHSDQLATQATFSRLTSAIGVVKIRLPESIQNQAEQLADEPIFAPTPTHDHKH